MKIRHSWSKVNRNNEVKIVYFCHEILWQYGDYCFYSSAYNDLELWSAAKFNRIEKSEFKY